MKKLYVIFAACIFAGCATNISEQEDTSYEVVTNGTKIASVPIRQTSTKTKARTFFDSGSSLANLKVTQSDKTQSTTIGSLNQTSSGTNAVAVLEKIEGIVKALPK